MDYSQINLEGNLKLSLNIHIIFSNIFKNLSNTTSTIILIDKYY